MTPDLAAVLTRVSEEAGEQINALDQMGVVYAREYAEFVLSGRAGAPPKPRGMNRDVAKFLRELTLDELTMRRMAR